MKAHASFSVPGAVPGCCLLCSEPPANPASEEYYEANLCPKHVEWQRAEDGRRAAERIRADRSVIRDMVAESVDVTVPVTYAAVKPPPLTARAAWLVNRVTERIPSLDPAKVVRLADEAARALLFQPGAFVLLAGPTGTGKSHMMALILYTLAELVPLLPRKSNPCVAPGGLFGGEWEDEEPNPYVLWRSAVKLFSEGSARAPVARYERVALLALDDIGKEPHQVNVQPVQDVLWERYDQERALLASTGFVDEGAKPDDLDAFLAPLARRYDSAAVRRLAKVKQRVMVIPMLPPA